MIRTLLAAAAISLAALPVAALPVTLGLADDTVSDFADGLVNDGDRAVSGPFGVTFQNVVAADGLPGSFVDFDGISLGRNNYGAISFDMIFDVDTVILSYVIDFNDIPDTTPTFFQIAGSNGTTGLNPLSETGEFAFDMGSIAFFSAGETYSLSHNVPSAGVGTYGGQIDRMVVTTPVPVPGSLAGLLVGIGFFGVAAVRRRRS